MKQIFTTVLSLFCTALLLSAAPFTASPDTLNRYVVDGKQVESFDGSQLEGKKITSYRTTVASTADGAIRIHRIQTKGSSKSLDPIYVVDGKMVSKKVFERMHSSDIESITIVKNGSQKDVKQYPGWENGVVLVETKGERTITEDKGTHLIIRDSEADSR